MTATPVLGLLELVESQAIPETTVNENMRYLEQGARWFAFLDRDLATPPGSPADGDAYLVATGATGAWSGHDGEIAYRFSTSWNFIVPSAGMAAYVADENAAIVFDGAAWGTIGGGGGSSKLGFSFQILGTEPTADEALATWTPPSGETVTFAANFAGCVGKKTGGGSNPAATYTLIAKKNGTQVGTIAISTGGLVTFATSGGATVALTGGTDTLTIYGATTPDTAVGYAFTMAGDL